MPGQVDRVLDAIEGWPVLAGAAYGWAAPPPDPRMATYLGALGAFGLVGLGLAAEERARIAALWKRRPDLRELLADAVGYVVCDELKAPFARQILDGERGDVARWVAAYPDLAPALARYFEARTRRFNHPLDAVDAVAIGTRYLGAPFEQWYAAASALAADARRTRDADGRRRFLRADLDTPSRLTDAELAAVNDGLDAIEAPILVGLPLEAWWHPQPLARGDLLARVAAASVEVAGDQWGLGDLERYARALALLDAVDRARFVSDAPELRRIRMRATELLARP